MREIVLDTETTGISPQDGHRLVEIGCLELFNHVATGKVYHTYIDPERDMPEGAFRVHGLSEEFLRGKPKFSEVADEFLEFIGDDPLVIHNASFDMGFINAELKKIGRAPIPMARAIDTLDMARRKFPGSQNNLDALCRRFNVDNSGRTRHGALLDSELLAEVYLELMGGRQPGLVLQADAGGTGAGARRVARESRPVPLPPRLSDEERAAHDAFVATLGEDALWLAVKG
ncbi:DNA polymerase III subunit epsilon [Parvibaculum sp.]|jgi:DNA polymerase III subunit epsilon|uniref:DNA polymerase III subunit epsilon n=1 Tax=Parvibaculum sp. TaxID=2024848 RepID=UPI000C66EB5F|nr:DNA polymerase III subunit epsilon [Parvibaculum sp.]MAM95888.1 DNA polymerase III subunit epsilon [Parvibaculum sp.]HCX66866.1 DNA polymerase III subunit epsilon [Rhodobiaceae bacterium]|tara:strand:- start:43009 stop:43698 length:690 start_codon:yes stop_codon:yes gene_type:complete